MAFRGENPEHFRSIPRSGKEQPHLPAALPSPAHPSSSLHAWEGRSEPFHGVLMLLLPFQYKIVPCHGARGLSPAATQPATSCSLGGTPPKPSLEQGEGEKAYSSRGKGISEQRVSQSQPPSHTASLFWLPGAHTLARLLRLPCRPQPGARRGTVRVGDPCVTSLPRPWGRTVPVPSTTAWGATSAHVDISVQGTERHPHVSGGRASRDVHHPQLLGIAEPEQPKPWLHPSATGLLVLVEMGLRGQKGEQIPPNPLQPGKG